VILENGGTRVGIEAEIAQIADQLLLAALKFLNPAQRTSLRMTLTAQVENFLNNVNFQSFSDVQTSPFFGLPTRARYGRRIGLSLRFDF
jgi:hypothetical protein